MQRIVKRTFGLGGGLLVLCAGLVACSGAKAKNWTFTDAEGSVRKMSDYEGQVLVLGFSNTWCDPCQDAAMEMQAIQDQFNSQGVKVVFVSAWEHGDPDVYMRENGYTYGLMVNGTEVAREYDVHRMPTFFVVGVDGRIVSRYEGFTDDTGDRITGSIEKHLEKVARHPERYRAYVQHGG